MAEMDEDGSGGVLAARGSQSLMQPLADVAHDWCCAEVDFTEFYQWWTNPKKATTLQGSTHSSFFEIEPY